MAAKKANTGKKGQGPTETEVCRDTYLTLASPAQGLYKEKGSKFLAFAYPVENEDQIKNHLEALHKEYFDARHHCYAYILGARQESYRANDDGEPSGTAGRPIHGQILSAGLTNVLVVVVRYFGGIKLGTSGLINAYKTATADALQQAEKTEKIVTKLFLARFPYEQMNLTMRLVKELQLQVLRQEADMECRLWLSVRLSDAARCQKRFEEERISLENVNS